MPPPAAVAPPPRRGQQVSLRESMRGLADTADVGRWEAGYSFDLVQCLDDTDVTDPCDPGDYTPAAHVDPRPRGDGERTGAETDGDTQPFMIRTGFRCSMQQGPVDNEANREAVRAQLELVTDAAIEAEFWTGALAQANGWPNRYLADAASNEFTDLTPAASDVMTPRLALTALQERLGPELGVIHANRTVVTTWQNERLVIREPGSNLIRDLYGNIVVAGWGYDGSAPDGTIDPAGFEHYVYGTGLVVVRVGEPQEELTRLVDVTDRETDTFAWRAWRMASATWDGCSHFGARVSVCETACDPGGS